MNKQERVVAYLDVLRTGVPVQVDVADDELRPGDLILQANHDRRVVPSEPALGLGVEGLVSG